MNVLFSVLGLIVPHRPSQYLGPETLMPLASILAAVAGFFLIFWRLIARVVKTLYRKIRGLPDEVPPEMDVEDSIEEEKDN